MSDSRRSDTGSPGEAMEVTLADEDIRAALLQESRRLMQFALAGEVLFWVILLGPGPDSALAPLSIAGYVGAWGAAVMGVSRGARAIDMSAPLRIGFYVLAFGMVFRLIPIAYFLGRSKAANGPSGEELRRQQTVEAARQRAMEREQLRQKAAEAGARPAMASAAPAPSPAPAPAPAPAPNQAAVDPVVRERVSKAIPRIRTVQNGMTEGVPVQVRYDWPPEAVALDMRAAPGRPQASSHRSPQGEGTPLSQADLPITRASGIFGLNYMVDDGHQYTSISDSELAASGYSLDELHQLAMQNLRRLVKQAQPGLKLQRVPRDERPGEAIMLTLDGDNEAAMLLIDELWDKSLARHIPNGVIAVAPARGVCVFIDLKSVTQGGMGDLLAVVNGVHQRQGHSFSGLLHRQAGRWVLGGEVQGLASA